MSLPHGTFKFVERVTPRCSKRRSPASHRASLLDSHLGAQRGNPLPRCSNQSPHAAILHHSDHHETVASIYHEGLLTNEQLEQHFSHYIEQLSRNHEVTEYLESNPEYFDGLRTLFKLQPRIDGELQAT